MNTLTLDQIRQLYKIAKKETLSWATSKNYVNSWEANCAYSLTQLAKEISNSESIFDHQVLPLIFGHSDLALLRKHCRNEYWFWVLAAEYSMQFITNPEGEPMNQAISSYRTRPPVIISTGFDLKKATLAQVCQLTATGCLLWDSTTNQVAENPMYLSIDKL